MIETGSLSDTLIKLGFDKGWVVSNHTIILWENDEPQPTEEELLAAGWAKPE